MLFNDSVESVIGAHLQVIYQGWFLSLVACNDIPLICGSPPIWFYIDL